MNSIINELLSLSNSESECFVLDTNMLLNAFKPFKHQQTYSESIKKAEGKIFVPFIVWIEFLHIVEEIIKTGITFCENSKNTESDTDLSFDIKKIINNELGKKIDILKQRSLKNTIDVILQNDTKNLKESTITQVFRDIDTDRLNSDIVTVLKKVMTDFSMMTEANKDDYLSHVKQLTETIREMINNSGIKIGSEYTNTELQELIATSKMRIQYNIPPGNSKKDQSKEKVKRWGELEIPSKYGDILLWLEVIKYAKECGKSTRYYLVTDDTKKNDWVDSTGRFFTPMYIEFLSKTDGCTVEHLNSSDFIQRFSGSKVSPDVIEIEQKQFAFSTLDTIVVPAQTDNFNKLFINEKCWHSIRIMNSRIPFLKYIAVYQTVPTSSVTHYAEIEEIIDSPYIEGKKLVRFKGVATKLDRPITLENPSFVVQSPRYTNSDRLFNSNTIQELFDYEIEQQYNTFEEAE